MRILTLEDSPIDDEIPVNGVPDEKDLGVDLTLSQIAGQGINKVPGDSQAVQLGTSFMDMDGVDLSSNLQR